MTARRVLPRLASCRALAVPALAVLLAMTLLHCIRDDAEGANGRQRTTCENGAHGRSGPCSGAAAAEAAGAGELVQVSSVGAGG